MSKPGWFPHGKEKSTTYKKALNYIPDTTQLETLGYEIKQQFDISGRLDYGRNWKNEIWLSYFRPGVRHQVSFTKELDSINIKRIERITLGEVGTRIHRTHGYEDSWIYIFWAGMVDLTGISFIMFSITGIMIWYHSRKNLKWGWYIIIPPIVLALSMFAFLY